MAMENWLWSVVNILLLNSVTDFANAVRLNNFALEEFSVLASLCTGPGDRWFSFPEVSFLVFPVLRFFLVYGEP